MRKDFVENDWIETIKNAPFAQAIICLTNEITLPKLLILISRLNRKVHVTQIKTQKELELIIHSREVGVKVTCDCAISSLNPAWSKYFNTKTKNLDSDKSFLFENIESIDCIGKILIP